MPLLPQVPPELPLAPLVAASSPDLTARLAALPFEQLSSLASSLYAAQQVFSCQTPVFKSHANCKLGPASPIPFVPTSHPCVPAQDGPGIGRALEGVQAVLDPRSVLSLCSTPLMAMPAGRRGIHVPS